MVFPTSVLGRWSASGVIVFLVFIGLFALAVAAGQRGGDGFFDNMWLTGPVLIAYVAAVAAFGLGLAAMATQGERSITVIATTVVGFLITLYGILEMVFPH